MKHILEIKFENCGVDQTTHEALNCIAERILLGAPTDSILRFEVHLVAGQYLASCRVISHDGIFSGVARGDTPLRAFGDVEKDINVQLKNWKNYHFSLNRFDGPSDVDFSTGARPAHVGDMFW